MSEFGSVRPKLGYYRPDFRSLSSELGSERPDLGSGRPDLGSEKLAFDLSWVGEAGLGF